MDPGQKEVGVTAIQMFSITNANTMRSQSLTTRAGLLPILLPTVAYSRSALLRMRTNPDSGYMDDPLRQDPFRADHIHAGIFLILLLVILQCDETSCQERFKRWVRASVPVATLFLLLTFFLSMLPPAASHPNGWICLAGVGFPILTLLHRTGRRPA